MSRTLTFSVVGVAVVAALAVATLFALRALGDPRLELPDELAGLTATDAEASVESADEERRADILERFEQSRAYNEEKYAEALDGAEVATRSYLDFGGNDGDLEQLLVVAADTDLGPLLPESGFPDPETLQVAAPTVEWSEHGDVVCLVQRAPTFAGAAEGEEPSAEDLEPRSVACQRTSGALSVRISTGDGDHRDTVIDAVEQVYADLD